MQYKQQETDMINFKYDFTETGITLQTTDQSHHFECARAAADAAYALMQGEDLDEALDNQEHVIIYDWHGDQNDLLYIVQNYDECKDDCDALFASVFFEELMLKHLINGKI
jgi:hypothetical protein